MIKFSTISLLLLSVLFSLLIEGCSTSYPIIQQLGPPPGGPVCRVAVLLFVNNSSYDYGDLIVYRIFVAELARSNNLTVSQEGDVLRIYRQLKIAPGQDPDSEQLRIIADMLNAQILISGTVVEMREKDSPSGIISLALDLQVIEPDSLDIIIKAHHRRKGDDYRKVMHFGTVNTITQLAGMVSREIIEKWFSTGGLEPCTE